MLKLKKIDLLTKNDKIHKKLKCLCWEEEESWDGWLAAVWKGRGGMGKKKEK